MSKTNASKARKWLLALGIFFLFALVALGTLTYWFLRLADHPEGARRLLGWVQIGLKEYANTELSYERIDLSSLQSVRLTGFKIQNQRQDNQFIFTADRLTWDVDLSQIFERKVVLNGLSIDNGKVSGELALVGEPSSVEASDLKFLDHFGQLFKKPAFSFFWKDVEIRNFSLELRLLSSQRKIHIHLPGIHFYTAGEYGNDRSRFELKSFNQDSKSWLFWRDMSLEQTVFVSPLWKTNVKAEIVKVGQVWEHLLVAPQMELSLNRLHWLHGLESFEIWDALVQEVEGSPKNDLREVTSFFNKNPGLEGLQFDGIQIDGEIKTTLLGANPFQVSPEMWRDLLVLFHVRGGKGMFSNGKERWRWNDLLVQFNSAWDGRRINTLMNQDVGALQNEKWINGKVALALREKINTDSLGKNWNGTIDFTIDKRALLDSTFSLSLGERVVGHWQSTLHWAKSLFTPIKVPSEILDQMGEGRLEVKFGAEGGLNAETYPALLSDDVNSILGRHWQIHGSGLMNQTLPSRSLRFDALKWTFTADFQAPNQWSLGMEGKWPALNWQGTEISDSDFKVKLKTGKKRWQANVGGKSSRVRLAENGDLKGVGIDLRAEGESLHGRLRQNITVQNDKIWQQDLDWNFKGQNLFLRSNWQFELSSELGKFLGPKQIQELGLWRGNGQWDISLEQSPPEARAAPLSWKDLSDWQNLDAKGKSKVQLTQSLPLGKPLSLIDVGQGISLVTTFAKKGAAVEFSQGVDLPHFEVSGIGVARGTNGQFDVKLRNIFSSPSGEVQWDWEQTQWTFADDLGSSKSREQNFSGLKARGQGELTTSGQWILKPSEVSFAGELFKLTAAGFFQNKSLNGQLEGKVKLMGDRTSVLGQTLSGRIEVPWKISISGGRKLSLGGEVNFDKFSWSDPEKNYGLSDAHGVILFSEEFVRRKENDWQLARLIKLNPFLRVDYDQMRPLLRGRRQLSVAEIQFEEETYGPLVTYLSLEQNLLTVHKFDLNLKSGELVGALFLNLHPEGQELGILAHVTRLNLSKTLPLRFRGRDPAINDKTLSARLALDFQVGARSLDGRIDITEIDGEQVVSLIDVLDPEYKDDTFNLARKGLSVSYPRKLALIFNHGFLDFQLSLAGLAQGDFEIRGVPVTPLISSRIDELLETIKRNEK
jgi:hypothetical protein